MNRKILTFLIAVLALCGILSSCIHLSKLVSEKVQLISYNPVLNGDFSRYKGKPIYLMNFVNKAQNTTLWCYFSDDRKIAYCGDSTLQTYFWFSFEKTMKHLGMVVSSEHRPDPTAPAVWMNMESITDRRYVVEVMIQTRWEPSFAKTYEISGDTSGNVGGSPADLEKRAYLMTDRLIGTILADAEFQEAYFKGVEELAPRKPL